MFLKKISSSALKYFPNNLEANELRNLRLTNNSE